MRYALAILIAALLLVQAPIFAQSGESKAATKAAVTRLPDGRPDLQGIWGFATMTPLQRPKEFAGRETLTAEEKANLERSGPRSVRGSAASARNTGSYNRFWIDAGTKVVATNRTSLIVDPPDGRVPPLTRTARRERQPSKPRRRLPPVRKISRPGTAASLGFNAGPPMIGGGYNAYVQLFQTPEYVVMLTEMVHDARIIPLDGRPSLSSHVRQWRGDSRGRWDGDTLVIETRNFRSEGTGTLSLRGLGLSGDENLHLIERFRRLDADTLLYEYTIDDPTIWTRPWTVSHDHAEEQPADVRVCVPRGELRPLWHPLWSAR